MASSSRGEKKKLLHVGSYEVGKTLGNGSFGKVKLGTNVFTKEKVAIKFFNHRKFATAQQVENTKREIEIMKLLSHPNIVKLVDVIEKTEDNTTYLIAEYVSGGELFDYIVANGVVKEKQARHFLRQIISAVEFCHANLIVHRDLKPENLLLDANGNIKISDFGLSNMIEPGKLLDSFCGSPLYAAPEILLAERYVGPPIDVWSIGVILFALLCGHLPWNGESQAEISHNSIKGIYEDPHEISASGRELIKKMLTPCPRNRITISEVRQHPWMNEGYDCAPPSMLTARQAVCDVRDDIVEQLVNLGFKNEELIRQKILDNECCQVVTMYHLILDRRVAEELAELKRVMLAAQQPAQPSPTKTPLKVQLPTNTVNPLKLSPLRNSTQLAIISEEEEANEISAADWNRIQEETEKEEEQTTTIPLKQSEPIPIATQQPYQHPNHKHIHIPAPSSPRHANANLFPNDRRSNGHHRNGDRNADRNNDRSDTRVDRNGDRNDRAQLSSSNPGINTGRRRYSVAVPDQMMHDRSLPQTSGEFGAKRGQGQRGPQQQQQQQQFQPQYQQQQYQQPDSGAPPVPRGRKFSLDSRAIAEQQQTAQEHGGGNNQPAQAGPGAPRLVKGVFKASTTTTRPPAEASKLVKKVLSNSSFFVKRKSPFIFECFDDESGVKFQLEVCKISQLDMTGIHLKRLVGDIWAYKNMCTTLVNKLSL